MKRALLIAALVVASFPSSVEAMCGLYLDGELWIGLEGYTLTSRGKVTVLDDSLFACPEIVSGSHTITSSEYEEVGRVEFADTNGEGFSNYSWDSKVTANGTIGLSYRARMTARQKDREAQEWGSSAFKLEGPPPKSTPDPGDGGSGEPAFYNYGSPILIDLGGAGYPLTDVDRGVSFDIDADGNLERVSWTKDGSVAFLFFDRDGDGVPASGAELFGDHTTLASGAVAANGFQALAEFDGNGDGAVTPADARWSSLRLWQDGNHDGRADSGEISTLDAASIGSLGIVASWNGRRDRHGNLFQWKSLASVGGQQRPFYDVYFVTE